MKFFRNRRQSSPVRERQLTVDARLLEAMRESMGEATPQNVLTIAAAYAAIYAISSDTAILPFKCFQRTPRGRREAPEKNATELLNVSPDGETTAIRFRQALMGHAVSRGNSYAEIRFRGDGQPGALHLLPPSVKPQRHPANGKLYYDLGDGKTLPPSRVLHLAGLGGDGLTGYSPIGLCKRTFDLTISAEQYGVGYWKNGSRPGGVITYPGEVTPAMRDNLVASWERMHRGAENASKVAVLEEGAAYHAITIPPEEAQFLETRKFQIIDIARIFRVPPHKIADYSQMQLASAGVEAANIDYVTTTLMVWCSQLEAEANRKLLTPEDRANGYYFKHMANALLRGAMAQRAEFYSKLFAMGVLSPNEIRELEEMNPVDGGDNHFVPLNMDSLESPRGEDGEGTEANDPDPANDPATG